jgi:RND family efflux transporter MFP subunit
VRNLVILVSSAALALAACGSSQGPEAARTAAELPPEVEVYLVPPADPEARRFSVSSSLSVEHEADLLAQEEGVLLEVLADQGQRVKRGQVLARLDDSRLRKELDQDRAEIQMAAARAKQTEVQREGAQVELQRQAELRKEGLGSERDFDRARFQLEALHHEVTKAQGDLARAKARVEADELRLSRMELRAPFDGIVARRYARTGELLLRDARVLRVTELRPLLVRFTVPEALRSAATDGRMVDVVPTGQAAARARAQVVRTSFVVDAASGAVECTARLREPVPEGYVPGMAVEVELVSAAAERPAYWIPAGAVRRHADGSGEVFVVAGDRLQKRSVKLGRESAGGYEALAGVAPGDRVVAEFTDKLRDGAQVRARSRTFGTRATP